MTLASRNPNKSYSAITKSRGCIRNSLNLGYSEPKKRMLETSVSFNDLAQVERTPCVEARATAPGDTNKLSKAVSVPENFEFFSPLPVEELDAAAVKVQKVYKSYRTRRHLADFAVVIEELWWKALDFAALKMSSILFFDVEKPETAASRWSRARKRVAKVGKGLSKDEKAQKLALRHWLEAIDPRHRYGHNLHLYYDVWSTSESVQPFFYWLDIGDGKEVNLEECPRTKLQQQCIKYLGPKERESYEVVIEEGKLVYKQSGALVNSVEGTKWIFVLSTTRNLYVGQKKKGQFQHSSFLAGGAITAAGRLMVNDGVLKAIWPYSGHYLPTEENFNEFLIFLEEHSIDLTSVKRYSAQEDTPEISDADVSIVEGAATPEIHDNGEKGSASELEIPSLKPEEATIFSFTRRMSRKWSTGAGPRIGCVREYPTELQLRALEQVRYSPRVSNGHFFNYGPIPSPRPSPKHRLSPNVAGMGLPSPRTPVSTESIDAVNHTATAA